MTTSTARGRCPVIAISHLRTRTAARGWAEGLLGVCRPMVG